MWPTETVSPSEQQGLDDIANSSCWVIGRVVLVDVDVADRLMADRVVLGPATGVVVTGPVEDAVVVVDGEVEVVQWIGFDWIRRERQAESPSW